MTEKTAEEIIETLCKAGYDIAIKRWHDDKPFKGYQAIAWRPGKVKETGLTGRGATIQAAVERLEELED